jgi:membrane-associated phospholipid phosphatase
MEWAPRQTSISAGRSNKLQLHRVQSYFGRMWLNGCLYQRFTLCFKLILLVPLVLWLSLFQLAAVIPYSKRPEIDMTTLGSIERAILFGRSLQRFPASVFSQSDGYDLIKDVLALLAAFVYLIHFVFVWLYVVMLYVHYRRVSEKQRRVFLHPWNFLWVFGWVNLLAVCTQLAWPTAPPWYVEQYGTVRPASYSISGEPAGLVDVDSILEYPLFQKLYGSSPIVFGSFPSLHGAWPLMITLYAPGRVPKVLCAIYTAWVWWAAAYLNHHYLVDLLGGAVYVVVIYMLGQRFVAWLTNKLPERVVLNEGAYVIAGKPSPTRSSLDVEMELLNGEAASPEMVMRPKRIRSKEVFVNVHRRKRSQALGGPESEESDDDEARLFHRIQSVPDRLYAMGAGGSSGWSPLPRPHEVQQRLDRLALYTSGEQGDPRP